jgi:hypothetical protein
VFVLLGLIFLCFLIFFWIREGLLLSEMCTFVASFLTCFFSLFCSLLMLPTALTKPQSPFLCLSKTYPLSSSHLHRKSPEANHQAQALRASPRANSQETRKRENSNQLTCVLILSITLSTNSSGYGNNSGAHLSATHARVKACRSEVRCGMRSVVDTEARMSSIFILLLLLLL